MQGFSTPLYFTCTPLRSVFEANCRRGFAHRPAIAFVPVLLRHSKAWTRRRSRRQSIPSRFNRRHRRPARAAVEIDCPFGTCCSRSVSFLPAPDADRADAAIAEQVEGDVEEEGRSDFCENCRAIKTIEVSGAYFLSRYQVCQPA